MKALFLVFHGFEAHNGISNKIYYQVDGLKQNGIDVRLCYLQIDDKGFHKRMVNDSIIENFGKGIWAKIKKRISYYSLLNYILEERIDFLYVRHDFNANPFLVSFFKSLKRKKIKSILEIPTYPYDNEFTHAKWKDRIQLEIDKLFRSSLSKTIFRIVTFTELPKIWDTPTICISNGIDFDKVRIKSINKFGRDKDNRLDLIGVADIHDWHGFDRLILGLADYYKQEKKIKVYFHIVGSGIEIIINQLKQIVIENNLEEYIKFYGPKAGLELDNLFDFADFGVASLARHRSNITTIKTLKNREYSARGIPFIFSENDSDFDHMPYVLKISADESPINIESVIDFYRNNTFSPVQIRESIYDLSWKKQMKNIIDKVII
nr:glycosyltransferase family 1 protein [uncultured Macellibacteroides sp.]